MVFIKTGPGHRSRKQRARFTLGDKRDLRKVKRAINNREENTHSTNLTAGPSSTVTVLNIMDSIQGLDSDDRIGDLVMPQRLALAGIVTLNGSASNSRLRIMVVRDNNGTTTAPVIGDLFSSSAKFVANKLPLGDEQSRSRFTIIWDKFILMDAGRGLTQTVSIKRKLAKKPLMFTGPAATNEGKNNLYLFLGSNEATNTPVVDMIAQVWYTDS